MAGGLSQSTSSTVVHQASSSRPQRRIVFFSFSLLSIRVLLSLLCRAAQPDSYYRERRALKEPLVGGQINVTQGFLATRPTSCRFFFTSSLFLFLSSPEAVKKEKLNALTWLCVPGDFRSAAPHRSSCILAVFFSFFLFSSSLGVHFSNAFIYSSVLAVPFCPNGPTVAEDKSR